MIIDNEEFTKIMLKAFHKFEQAGFIKDDLCFDPEHWISTTMWEHWNR